MGTTYRTLTFALVLCLSNLSGVAHASVSGRIAFGHPVNHASADHGGAGLTATIGACQLDSPLQGFDGQWFHLSQIPGSGGKLTVTPAGAAQGIPAALNTGIKLFDSACGPVLDAGKHEVGNSSITNGPDTITIRNGTAWVLVYAYWGTGPFTVARHG